METRLRYAPRWQKYRVQNNEGVEVGELNIIIDKILKSESWAKQEDKTAKLSGGHILNYT